MDLKTYHGNSMADALAKVKKDLGRDAVILHTRTIRRGGWLGFGGKMIIEITARRDINVLPATERRALMGPGNAARGASGAWGGGRPARRDAGMTPSRNDAGK